MSDQFKETLKRFRDYTGYISPITFQEWSSIKDTNYQVGILYCQFYDQITLAWFKAKADFVTEEDGVSCVLQYLTKNVPIILSNSSKFTPNYIYTISYNCMDCLRFIQRDINRSKLETSNNVRENNEELDLFNLCPYNDLSYEEKLDRKEFWSIIENMGMETEKVINYLLNGESLRRVSKRSKAYGVDPLSDVSVNSKRYEEIMEELRQKLSGFKEIYYI